MTKIIKLNNVEKPEQFIKQITDKELLIYEDIQGSQVYAKFTGDRFIIKPKSIKNEELNFIDLTVQKFYNQVFNYLHSLPTSTTDMINTNWWFVFEYFPDNQPGNIEYSRRPKNSLILTCLLKGSKHVYNIDELVEYSKLLDVDTLPILYKGKLNNKQLEIISLFLNVSEKDLNYVFGEDNFAEFFYSILNPNVENSVLMGDNEFNDNIEKLVIRIDGNTEYSFEILNPIHKKLSLNNNTEYVEIYSLIIINFLEFLQTINLEKVKLKKLTKEELYVELICDIYNKYIENVRKDIIDWVFHIPDFFKEDKFKINIELIGNKRTIETIKSNQKLEYTFKVLLSSFFKRRKKPIGLLTKQTVEMLNQMVDNINKKLDLTLNINREYKLQKSDVMNFGDFFNMDFNLDVNGKLWPDTYSQFDDTDNGENKKKKDIGYKKKK